jgi:hypothetical protein
MAKKFNRNYRLTVQSNPRNVVKEAYNPNLLNATVSRLYPALGLTRADNKTIEPDAPTAIEIKPPFTIELNVERSIIAGNNTATIKILGLNESTRKQLWKDPFDNPILTQGSGQLRQVILEAGYGKELHPIFIGSLTQGYSQRERVEEATYLKCVSGEFGRYNTFINQNYTAGTSYNTIINDVIDELTKRGDIQKGAITVVDGTSEGFTALGDSIQILSQFGCHVYIDLGKINMLKLDEVIANIGPKNIYQISADTGLIGTPIRTGNAIEIQTMFEPQIPLGGLIELKSTTAKYFNGQFKVMYVKHNGIISYAKDGKLITTIGLYIGNWLNGSFKNIFLK